MSKLDKQARHESRIRAVKTLFNFLERDQKVPLKKCLSYVQKDVDEMKGKDDFAKELLERTEEDMPKIKILIRSFASDFLYEKIAPINRSILLLGIAEMKYFDTPPIVVINEYVDLAKEFGEEKSAPFVNAVLDEYRKSLGKN